MVKPFTDEPHQQQAYLASTTKWLPIMIGFIIGLYIAAIILCVAY
jgi:uncharacterized membrane-anchored protein YhcB (DUF1043 family)